MVTCHLFVVEDARHPLGVRVRVMQVMMKILKDGSFLFFCFCFGKGNYTRALVFSYEILGILLME